MKDREPSVASTPEDPTAAKTAAASAADLLRAMDFTSGLEEMEAAHRERVEPLLLALVDVLDAADRLQAGLTSIDEGRNGLRQIARALEAALRGAGAEVAGRVGEPVDPSRQRIVEVRPQADTPDETVVAVVRRGCVFEGRVLRPAMVVIGSMRDGVGT